MVKKGKAHELVGEEMAPASGEIGVSRTMQLLSRPLGQTNIPGKWRTELTVEL